MFHHLESSPRTSDSDMSRSRAACAGGYSSASSRASCRTPENNTPTSSAVTTPLGASTPVNYYNNKGTPKTPENAQPPPVVSKSTLPRPLFSHEPETFSTKKERRFADFKPPPRPPAKSCPPKSRVFRHADLLRAQAVTFLDSPDGTITGTPLHSAVYDTSKKQSYFQQAFQIETEIGAGYFGTVYRVRSKEDGKVYAVKIARDKYKGPSDRKRKLDEVRKHQFLPPHSNCVRFYQSWEENGRLYLQFELCQGNLLEFTESRESVPESVVWNHLVDLLQAIQHLHDHDLVHMDIKPDNIFIGMDGICKLGDFGLVIDLAKSSQENMEGDPKYLAPEVMQGRFTKACDVFSVGATLLELACDLDLPRGGHLWHDLRSRGPDPALTLAMSAELRRVVELMMIADPDRRPTVRQVLDLPSVAAAVRRRERQLAVRWCVDSVRTFLHPAVTLLVAVSSLLLSPVVWLWRSLPLAATAAAASSSNTPDTATAGTAAGPGALLADTFSDDDDGDCTVSTEGSDLAAPLQDSTSSGGSQSRQDSPVSRSSPFVVRAMTTPGAEARDSIRYRSRHLARTPGWSRPDGVPVTVSPQKRLLFDLDLRTSNQDLDNSITREDDHDDDDDDDDDIQASIKPHSLVATFECFSDDDP